MPTTSTIRCRTTSRPTSARESANDLGVARIEDAVGGSDAARLVSAATATATALEIAIKWGLGKLRLPEPPPTYVPSRVRGLAAESVPISIEDAVAVGQLEPLHRDPFDRLLVVQARALGAVIVTADPQVERYPVDVLRVGER